MIYYVLGVKEFMSCLWCCLQGSCPHCRVSLTCGWCGRLQENNVSCHNLKHNTANITFNSRQNISNFYLLNVRLFNNFFSELNASKMFHDLQRPCSCMFLCKLCLNSSMLTFLFAHVSACQFVYIMSCLHIFLLAPVESAFSLKTNRAIGRQAWLCTLFHFHCLVMKHWNEAPFGGEGLFTTSPRFYRKCKKKRTASQISCVSSRFLTQTGLESPICCSVKTDCSSFPQVNICGEKNLGKSIATTCTSSQRLKPL